MESCRADKVTKVLFFFLPRDNVDLFQVLPSQSHSFVHRFSSDAYFRYFNHDAHFCNVLTLVPPFLYSHFRMWFNLAHTPLIVVRVFRSLHFSNASALGHTTSLSQLLWGLRKKWGGDRKRWMVSKEDRRIGTMGAERQTKILNIYSAPHLALDV